MGSISDTVAKDKEDKGFLYLYLYLRYNFEPCLLMVSVSKDTEDTALQVSVSGGEKDG